MGVFKASLTMGSLMLTTPVYAEDPDKGWELYRIRELGGGLGIHIDQTVVFTVRGLDQTGLIRLIVERIRTDKNWCGLKPSAGQCHATETKRHDWIDSSSCPQVRLAMDALSHIPPPPFKRPGSGSDFTTVSDTALLTIEGLPEQGKSTAQSVSITEYTGPYQAWWHRSQEELGPCWKEDAPEVNGYPVRPTLIFSH